MAKNVILFSLDTTRADHLSCYGYHRPTSPNLDKIAAKGTIFAECISANIPTFPGHMAMFTGTDPYSHNLTGMSGDKYQPAENIKMLAEILKENGYWCGCADNLGRWFTRGFDQVERYSWSTDKSQVWRKGESVNTAALKALDGAAGSGKPFFLFFHYWDPHTPYLPPEPFSHMFYSGNEKDPKNKSLEKMWKFEPFKDYFAEWMPGVTDRDFVIGQYDSEIAYLDVCLQHVFTRLAQLGLADDTLLVITADHGEEMDEHDCWFDHHGLYDTNLHVPMILHHPGVVPAGQTRTGLVTLYDVAPTILDYAGLGGLAAKHKMLGQSLLPLAQAKSPISRGTCDEVYLSENTWMRKRGVRTHQWKYIHALEPDCHGLPEEELYHLTTDPEEKVNVAAKRPEVTKYFRERLDAYVAKRVKATGRKDPFLEQPIPMHRIGKLATAVPKGKDEAPKAAAPAPEAKAAKSSRNGKPAQAKSSGGKKSKPASNGKVKSASRIGRGKSIADPLDLK
ncbi:MAG: sulfatase-like hydrolase/transferase [Planctomycetes bacterium]|nr:sulfatase-like hydrolase/transferase [Planctomycetota bacterium]